MTLESPGDTVIYRSHLNAKINRNFEVFTPTDFLAAITQHIPDKGVESAAKVRGLEAKRRTRHIQIGTAGILIALARLVSRIIFA